MDFKHTVHRKRLQMPQERATEEAIWPLFVKIRRAGGNLRHNLGTAASRDDTAEKKNKEDEKEEEEWVEEG